MKTSLHYEPIIKEFHINENNFSEYAEIVTLTHNHGYRRETCYMPISQLKTSAPHIFSNKDYDISFNVTICGIRIRSNECAMILDTHFNERNYLSWQYIANPYIETTNNVITEDDIPCWVCGK